MPDHDQELLRFVAERGKRSCRLCLQYDDLVFAANDPDKPKLPLHYRCRCRYEVVTPDQFALKSGDTPTHPTQP